MQVEIPRFFIQCISFFPVSADFYQQPVPHNLFLTYFSPMFHFSTCWKSQRTFGFLTFSGVKNRNIGQWRRSSIFIVNFEHISHLVLVFLLLTLSR